MSEIKMFTKMIPTDFLILEGEEFEARKLLGAINDLDNTEEWDTYGDYSLRDYQVDHMPTMKKLVKLGYARTYIGSRMAHLYCVTSKEKLNKLRDDLYEAWEKFEENKEA